MHIKQINKKLLISIKNQINNKSWVNIEIKANTIKLNIMKYLINKLYTIIKLIYIK